VLLRGHLRIGLLVMIWSCAIVGIACKWLLSEPSHDLTVGLYVAMGWTGLFPVYQLVQAIGLRGMAWGLLGGVLYTAGGICEAVRWPVLWPQIIGYHEVFHVFDMGATLIHIFFMIRYVLPYSSV
jgi:hemolysin III